MEGICSRAKGRNKKVCCPSEKKKKKKVKKDLGSQTPFPCLAIKEGEDSPDPMLSTHYQQAVTSWHVTAT